MAIKFLNTVSVDSSVLHVDAATDRVGVGTSAPGYKLDVNGKAQFRDDVLISGSHVLKNINTHLYLDSATGHGIFLRPNNGVTSMYLNNTGNVGIGTTSPTKKLEVNGTVHLGSSGNDVSIGSSSSSVIFMLRSGYNYIQASDASGALMFRTGGSNNRMIITSAGNVGIGTTSPAGPLTIANANNGNWNDGLIIDDPTGWAATVYKRSNVPKMFTGLYSGNDNYIWMSTGYDNTGTTITAPRTDAVLMARPGTDDLQIYLDTHFGGNVGIGTTSPSEKLTVTGNIQLTDKANSILFGSAGGNGAWGAPKITRIDSSLIMSDYSGIQLGGYNGSSYGARMVVKGTGEVGIGTTDPNAKLHVVNGSSGQTYSNVSGALIDVNGTSNSYSALRVGSSAGNNHLVVTNAGKVGIGATSPNEKLSVDTGSNASAGYISVDSQTLTRLKLGYSFTSSPSAITAAQIYADSSGNLDISSRGNAASAIQLYTSSGTSPSERMRITSDGNVGIGTTSPNEKLEVTGNAIVSGNLTFKPKHYGAADDLNNDSRSVYSTHQANGTTSNRPINYSSVYTFGGQTYNALQISTNEDYSESGMWIRQYNQNAASPQGTGWQNWTEVWTTNHAPLSKITNWDTAYNYSQVGHLPLSAGSGYPLTGTLYIGNVGGDQKIQFQRTGGNVYSIEHDSAQLYFYNRTTTEAPLVIQNDGDVLMNAGNVGIGATNPLRKLHVVGNFAVNAGTGEYYGVNITGGEGANPNILIGDWHNSSANIGWDSAGNYLRIDAQHSTSGAPIVFSGNDSAIEYMRITSGGNVGIGTTNPSQKLHVAGNMRLQNQLYDSTNSTGSNGQVLTKTSGGTIWADNKGLTPITPGGITATIVGETIEIAFNQSTTSNIDYYQVWSSDDGGDYGIIGQIAPADFSATMTVVDTTFVTGGTMSYRVYAVKAGVYSPAGTVSKAYTVSALDVTNMTVVNLNTAYYVQYEKPISRFIDHIEIWMDSQTTQAALNRSNATLVYSGQNTSYMRSVGTSSNFHQFWVEVVTS